MKIAALVSRILPEGRYKESLRRVFCDYNNPLYRVNKIIDQSESCPDNMLLIRLNNGFKCYGLPRGGKGNFRFRYGNRQKLDRINGAFGSFYYHLYEQFIQKVYEKKYQYPLNEFRMQATSLLLTYSVSRTVCLIPH